MARRNWDIVARMCHESVPVLYLFWLSKGIETRTWPERAAGREQGRAPSTEAEPGQGRVRTPAQAREGPDAQAIL